jgi:nitrilase
LLDQAVDIPSASTDRLCKAAKEAKAYVAIGVNERNYESSGASIYNTLLYIGADGEIMGKHRKLMPTSAERLVWAAGDGSTLETYHTDFGTLGGLLCWENRMPLARYAMYAWGTQVYVAPTWDSSDSWIATLRHIATEGRCFVIGSCIAMRTNDIPDHYEFKAQYEEEQDWINQGNSAIVNPDGYIIAGPAVNEETILYADLDMELLRGSKLWFDAAGHYARPDVFQLTVNRNARPMIVCAPVAGTEGVALTGGRPRRTRAERM